MSKKTELVLDKYYSIDLELVDNGVIVTSWDHTNDDIELEGKAVAQDHPIHKGAVLRLLCGHSEADQLTGTVSDGNAHLLVVSLGIAVLVHSKIDGVTDRADGIGKGAVQI